MLLPTLTLRPGDSGENVRELQRRLVAVGQLDEGNINASYDGPTTDAVSSFQATQALKVDGVAGPKTIRRLNAVVAGTVSAEGESDTRKDEEEKDIAKDESVAMADEPLLEEPELAPEALGLDAPAVPEMPSPPPREPAPEPQQVESTDSLFLDDPSLEVDALKHEPKQEEKPKLAEEQSRNAPAEKTEPPKSDHGANLANEVVAEPIRFDDPRLASIDRALPEPVKMEVREAGVVMLEKGVKQSAVPDEMNIGGPSQTPQVEQQKTAEIGA